MQVQELSFGYPGCELLYSNVEFGVDMSSRIALVGPNGVCVCVRARARAVFGVWCAVCGVRCVEVGVGKGEFADKGGTPGAPLTSFPYLYP